jgi:co-chaperonin GroES (HSP10)
MVQLIAAHKYVLLKPLGVQKNKSGLVIPESQEKKPEIGIIFKIGSGKQPFEKPLEEGDTVIFKKYMSNEITIPSTGEKVNPIAFEDLVCLLREDKDE